MKKIPVIFMFDDNYAIPAAVAIYSMIENADKKYMYDIHILYTDIKKQNMLKLCNMVKLFENVNITFRCMKELDKKLHIPKNIAGWPKEIIYKLLIADIFPELERVIITDADVVFLDDISCEFLKFNSDEYFAGVKQSAMTHHQKFSTDITDNNMHFLCGAGYMIYNLKKMRTDNMVNKYLNFMRENMRFLKLPDQEILNIVSYPNIKLLSPRNMTLVTYYVSNDYVFNKYSYASTKEEHEEAKKHPVQLHYVTYTTWGKPWTDFNAPCAELWYRYLTYTPFFLDFCSTKFNHKKKMPTYIRFLLHITPIKAWRQEIRKRYY